MKKLLKSLVLFAAAAMALTSCENEIFDENIESNDNVVTMTFNAGAPESKTAVSIDGDVATFTWSANDKVGFFKQAKGLTTTQETNGTGEGKISVLEKVNSKNSAETGATATFTTELHTAEGADNGYQIGAFFPGNAWKSYDYTNGISAVKVAIPAAQKPVATSFDSQADLMMSNMIEMEELDNSTQYTLKFARLAAIGCMNLKGVVAGETITNVTITFDESAVVNGNVDINFVGGYAKYAEEGSNVITLTPTNVTALADGTPIYFTCFPGAYTGALTVSVATTAENSTATYTKVIETLPDALTFTAGDVTKFNLTVKESSREEVAGVWTLIKDASTLAAGDQIIIAASGSNYALSTTQSSNNRTAVAITKDGDTLDTPSADVQVITLAAGASTGTWAFSVGENKYLYAAGGTSTKNNYLRTTSTLNAAASWKVTIANTGVASIVTSDTSVVKNTLMKNSSSAIFSCYSSGQSTVCIYKLVGGNAGGGGTTPEPEPDPEEPETPVTPPAGESGTVTFDFTDPASLGITKPASSAGTDIKEAVVVTPITLTTTNGGTNTRIWNSNSSCDLRVYKNGGTLVFTADSGKTITSIVFTGTLNMTASVGDLSSLTWTGSASSVTFTASDTNKIKTAVITYN